MVAAQERANKLQSGQVVGSVLVVGGGIAGIQASLDLADSGYRVHLVESSPSIGGTMAQLDKTFPTNDCSTCILSPKVVACARHLNINLMTWSEVDAVSGEAGRFDVRIRHKARMVDPARCTGCGDCAQVCPVEVPGEFDEGQGQRTAIYRTFPQAVPNVFTIDKRGTAPCKAACPAGTSVQGYVALIAKGRYAEALELSRKTNPFTSVCGRICYHPCESACSRSLLGESPVAIRELKRFMADWAVEHGDTAVEPVPVTRVEKVAIIGGGPAGLTAASDLARLGYAVTVFEAQPELGGMMRYGIAENRLPREILDAEIKRITDLGIHVNTSAPVSDLEALQEEYQAIVLCIGTRHNLPLRVAGEQVGTIPAVVALLRKFDEGVLPRPACALVAAGGEKAGPRSVIDAVGMGHRAAEQVHRALSGEDIPLLPRIDPEKIVTLEREEISRKLAAGIYKRAARNEPVATVSSSDNQEPESDVLGYTEAQALDEARRCLACGGCAECDACVRACKPQAVDHALGETFTDLQVGAVILATGFDEFDARRKYELGYSRYPDVVTSIEFERILSASGPCGGHVVRPSDGRTPRRIAFLQCVGSRDTQCGNVYCSSVCCMYAIKEAVIAREHSRDVETTIFFMDMRAFGKDFDKYYERARDEYGVRFTRSRVAKVDANADGTLDVVYVAEDDRLVHEPYDMVVLSVGLEPSRGTRDMMSKLGLRSGEGGFIRADEFTPLSSSRPGVFICGAASGPKDIPETVMQASAAAAEAGQLLASQRGTLSRVKEYPGEMNVLGVPPRVGVFVCHCGTNIAATVDVEAVREYARTLPYVVYAGRTLFACSQDNLETMKDIVERHGINRVVVASCSPRTHEELFQETIHEVGLNPYLFELANIRDQCSWVHMSLPAEATDKAKDLVRMAVSRVVNDRPLHGRPVPVTRSALVIGGGLTGMSAALKMAGQGFGVHLVEQEPELGGNARYLAHTLRGADVQAYLKQMVEKVKAESRIRLHLQSRVRQVDGFVGNFRSVLEFIGDDSDVRQESIEHGVIIVATGAQERSTTAYLRGQDKRVLTQRELEQGLASGAYTLPAGQGRVVMIQCVESRTPEHPYCSRVCCAEALKNAITLKQHYPQAEVVILYRDIRSYGLREEFYQQARDLGVLFVRYELEPDSHGKGGPPVVFQSEGQLRVQMFDPVSRQQLDLSVDTLVLSVGISPHPSAETLAPLLKVPLNAERFYLEAHMKLRPVEFATEGIFLAGMAHGPKFIEESIAQAGAAVSRACTVLSKSELVSPGTIAFIDQNCCVACGDCVAVCPYKAIAMAKKEVTRRNWKDCAEVNPALCKGCGACTAACRSGCITLDGSDDMQIMAQITALMAG